MLKKTPLFLLVLIMSLAFWIPVNYAAGEKSEQIPVEAYHNRNGLDHFNKGFYDLTPRHRKEEAAKEYGLAIEDFKNALAANPDYAQAHRNLGKVYSVQGKPLQAAKHYKKLTVLDPSDIDAYVLTALAYAEAQMYDEARVELEAAKGMTTNKRIIKKLDEYLTKLPQQEQ